MLRGPNRKKIKKGEGRSMEKICIVNLRKKMVNSVDVQREGMQRNLANENQRLRGFVSTGADRHGIREMDDGRVRPDNKKDATERTVSLMLTQDQTKTLRSNPHIKSFLSAKHAEGSEAMRDRDGTVVVKFEFESIPRLRLLKAREVIQMLRISRSYLNRLVRQGMLKSYKFGRLRRFVLEDVLSFLEESQELTGIRQQDSKSEKVRKEMSNVM
jgi:excisionase family DNA binding protein